MFPNIIHSISLNKFFVPLSTFFLKHPKNSKSRCINFLCHNKIYEKYTLYNTYHFTFLIYNDNVLRWKKFMLSRLYLILQILWKFHFCKINDLFLMIFKELWNAHTCNLFFYIPRIDLFYHKNKEILTCHISLTFILYINRKNMCLHKSYDNLSWERNGYIIEYTLKLKNFYKY